MQILTESSSSSVAGKKMRSSRKRLKFFFWSIITIIVAVALWIGITGFNALGKITTQNTDEGPSFFRNGGTAGPTSVRREGDGRINILLLGIGGGNHPGAMLSDTMEVLSIDPLGKTSSVISIPRDLYVTNSSGDRSKINSVYSAALDKCGNNCSTSVDAGGQAVKDVVSKIFDLPIHYYARIDFAGFAKVIDTLGGIQVNVEKPLNDPFFPDDQTVGYQPLYIPAGLQTMDGTKALKYARSRETTSDFDRSHRQQQVIAAAREKALKINVLANPKKITDIITTLGDHLRTDMKLDEMKKVFELVGQIDGSNTVDKVLDTSPDSPLKSLSDPNAGYIIVPKKGLFDYSDLQLTTSPLLTEPYLTKEAARVLIINASGSQKIGEERQTKLKSLGYIITNLQTANKTQKGNSLTVVHDKPFAAGLLGHRFSTTATASITKAGVDADIILTLGTTELER